MVSDRVRRIAYSPTLAVSDLAAKLRAEGRDVLDFSAGQPDFPTPDAVKEAGRYAISSNRTRYTATAGIPELRIALAERLATDLGVEYEPRQILVSPGAKASLYFAFQALCEPGDEVLVPRPYWTSYPEQVKLAGAVPVFVDCAESEGFVLDAERLDAACTERSRVLVLNDPSNPTGAGYTRRDLERIGEVCLRRGLSIVSDEIYSKLVYESAHVSIAALSPELAGRTLVIDGMSKTYSMTGWRIGYAAGPREWIEAMTKLQSHATSNATSISQWAAVAALALEPSELEPNLRAFAARRDRMVAGLEQLRGVSCVKPRGAFYVFPNVSGLFGGRHGLSSGADVARWLLERECVALVPGEAFGAPEHVRLSFACSMEQVGRGLERIARAVASLAA